MHDNTTLTSYSNLTSLISGNTSLSASSNATFAAHNCFRKVATNFAVILALIGLPLNLLLLKILKVNFRLGNPRHKVLLSLLISDCFQITYIALIQFIAAISNLKTTHTACQVLRKSMEVTAVVTVVASSGSILALSVERYIACIYCLRAVHMLSDSRVERALIGIWSFSFILSLCDDQRYLANMTSIPLPLTQAFKIIYACVVITSTAIILCIQVRLYRQSHRLMTVHPGTGRSFGSTAEANDIRRSQLKVSLAASGVVIMYVVCMCPLAFYIIATAFQETDKMSNIRLAVIFLAQINTFADPFVYGIGMGDTRRAIMREIRNIKRCLSRSVGYFPEA